MTKKKVTIVILMSELKKLQKINKRRRGKNFKLLYLEIIPQQEITIQMFHILSVSPQTITKQNNFPFFFWLCERTTEEVHSQKYLSTKVWPLNSRFKFLFLFICLFNIKCFKQLQLVAAICTASVLSQIKLESEIRGRKPQVSVVEISQNNLNSINFIFSTVTDYRRFLHISVHAVRYHKGQYLQNLQTEMGCSVYHQSVITMLQDLVVLSLQKLHLR